MANSLGLELQGKKVILHGGREFLCEGGFGCHPSTAGRSIFGKLVKTGEELRVSGTLDVESLAPGEEGPLEQK